MLRLSAIAVLLATLVGCGAYTNSYVDSMIDHVENISNSMDTVLNFLDSPEDYRGDIDEELNNIIHHAEAIRQYKGVPDEYLDYHVDLSEAVTYYKYGSEQLLLVRDGTGGEKALYEAVESFKRASLLLERLR